MTEAREMLVFRPKEININYHDEWVIQCGALCYGIIVRKKDNKVLFTYNINPEHIHEDYFDKIDETQIPKSVYRLFQQKLSSDIGWADRTMMNIVNNKKILSSFFNFAEEMKEQGSDELADACEYTEQDAIEDNKNKQMIQTTNKLNMKPNKKKKITRKKKK